MHSTLRLATVALVVVLAGCAGILGQEPTQEPTQWPTDLDGNLTTAEPLTPPPGAEGGGPTDSATPMESGSGSGAQYASGGATAAPAMTMTAVPQATASSQVGYSTGGAQDAHAFRHNIEEGYVPQPTDVTYEGIFRDYYFDTGQSEPCSELFCPSYSRAVTTDPLSNETERYVTVGLNSNITKEAFERKDLNLVVVLDTSGSMEEGFNSYYYDDGEKQRVEDNRRKIDAATDAIAALTRHLGPDDRLGVVTYSERAHVFQDVRSVGEMDMANFRQRLEGIQADGGTNLDAGMHTATSLLRPYRNPDSSDRETRVIYVTDAMPNTGQTRAGSLTDRLQSQADDGIYSTFVGVGVDFNSKLVEAVTDTRGANYYTVQSPEQFRERMDETGFSYMVTPMVFDLELSVDAEGYRIKHVYGTANESASTGRLMHVKTLFPSRSEGGKTKGGVVLLELARTGSNPEMQLTASYEDRQGREHTSTRNITFETREPPYFESSGVRKAVLLKRHATMLRNWAAYERAQVQGDVTPSEPSEVSDPIAHRRLGQWEQQSVDLRVSDLYRQRFERFESYFAAQMAALGDEDLEQDLDILERLSDYPDQPPTTTATPVPAE